MLILLALRRTHMIIVLRRLRATMPLPPLRAGKAHELVENGTHTKLHTCLILGTHVPDHEVCQVCLPQTAALCCLQGLTLQINYRSFYPCLKLTM